MYIKCDYCKTSIERLLSEHGNDSFQITIHCSPCIRFHGFTLQHFQCVDFFLIVFIFIFGVLTPLSAIFQLYHGDQFLWWRKPEYPERTTDHGQATDKLYHSSCDCEPSALFLAHLVNGHVSFCHHLASVVRS
jgi:hypothetical protein